MHHGFNPSPCSPHFIDVKPKGIDSRAAGAGGGVGGSASTFADGDKVQSEKVGKIKKEFTEVQISIFEEANVEDVDLIVVSVKKQDFQYVAGNLPFQLKDNNMEHSIKAGVKMKKIQFRLEE